MIYVMYKLIDLNRVNSVFTDNQLFKPCYLPYYNSVNSVFTDNQQYISINLIM